MVCLFWQSCVVRLIFLLAFATAASAAAPCTKPDASCTERVPLGTTGKYGLAYRSHPLRLPDSRIERMLIVIHGAGRNADDYFASGEAGAFLAQALETTLVVSPRFGSNTGTCKDALADGEISWGCGGTTDWRGGGKAGGVDSFVFVEELMRLASDKTRFPTMKEIVVSGHSAGGQFVHRFAAASRVQSQLSAPVKYVVSNPSTYLYLDTTRLGASATCSQEGKCTGAFANYSEGRNCTTFNQWRNGLEKRWGYAETIPEEEIKQNLMTRNVTYLLGELDTQPIYGFDGTCPAMAQGATRLARGVTYWNYITSKFNAAHKLVVVPACGHNGRCIYTADAARPVLFGK